MLQSLKKYFSFDFNKNETDKEIEKIEHKFILKYQNNDIGYLVFDSNKWFFEYSDWFKNQNELELLFEFPEKTKTYNNDSLWPFFKSRIPSEKQPKVQEYYQENPINRDDLVKLLEVFGMSSINNPYKLYAC